MFEVVLLLLIGAIAWFGFDTLRARESALRAGARACAELNVQFLDQSVALARVRVGRNAQGHACFRREYRFEFSTDGADRRPGSVALLGAVVEMTRLESPGGAVVQSYYH
jgi:hypothetical protein